MFVVCQTKDKMSPINFWGGFTEIIFQSQVVESYNFPQPVWSRTPSAVMPFVSFNTFRFGAMLKCSQIPKRHLSVWNVPGSHVWPLPTHTVTLEIHLKQWKNSRRMLWEELVCDWKEMIHVFQTDKNSGRLMELQTYDTFGSACRCSAETANENFHTVWDSWYFINPREGNSPRVSSVH